MLDLRCMVEHMPEQPDLILFLTYGVSVVHAFRCGLARGMLVGEHVLALIIMIITYGSFKIISNRTVLVVGTLFTGTGSSPCTWRW